MKKIAIFAALAALIAVFWQPAKEQIEVVRDVFGLKGA